MYAFTVTWQPRPRAEARGILTGLFCNGSRFFPLPSSLPATRFQRNPPHSEDASKREGKQENKQNKQLEKEEQSRPHILIWSVFSVSLSLVSRDVRGPAAPCFILFFPVLFSVPFTSRAEEVLTIAFLCGNEAVSVLNCRPLHK